MTTPETALWFLNTRISIVLPAGSGADRLSVLKHWAPYGDSPPLHIHDTEDEVFHILEGRLHFQVDGAEFDAEAGQTVLAPKGIPHSFRVDSPAGAKFLTVTRPGDFEAMVRAVSRPATAPGLPAPAGAPTPEMAAQLAAVCAMHGIRLVGAPLALPQAA